MAKKPQAGQTKTRLHSRLEPEVAARLYECLLLDTIELVRRIPDATPLIAIDPPEAVPYFASIAPDLEPIVQLGDGLGARLDHVLGSALDRGFTDAVAIGSDSPTLPIAYIERAFASLGDPAIDLVLGPAEDGGYYLIGVTQRPGPIVTEVTMSTPDVLADTLEVARSQSLRVELLDPWYDIDEPEDLDRFRSEVEAGFVGAENTRLLLSELHRSTELRATGDV